jgi:hypothetical protein
VSSTSPAHPASAVARTPITLARRRICLSLPERTFIIVVTAFALLISAPAVSSAATATSSPPTPWFGVLQAQPAQAQALTRAGVNAVTVELAWAAYEPSRGQWNSTYVQQQRARIAQLDQQGTYVILDLGLQYPPTWAFDLPGATHLQDQYGNTWSGDTGAKIVNAVFNPEVRAAQDQYIAQVATDLPVASIGAVRVGGLNMGELSYPPSTAAGGTSLWMYDASAQSLAPVPGWRPGSGSASDAQRSLDFYYGSLTSYGSWLLDLTARSFPQADLHLLLPSWGLRPGQTEEALAAGLRGTTPGEINDQITQGLDWSSQIPLLTRYGGRAVAYTTWLDAPSQGTTPRYLSPAEYIYSLARPLNVAVAGENTGGSNVASMQLCLERVRELGLRGMLWMTASTLLANPDLTAAYADGAQQITAQRHTPTPTPPPPPPPPPPPTTMPMPMPSFIAGWVCGVLRIFGWNLPGC